MEDLLLLMVALGALFLVFAVGLLIGNRRKQAEQEPFVAELPVPPEVLAAVRGARLAEAAAAEGDEEAAGVMEDAVAGELALAATRADDRPSTTRPRSPGSHVPLVDALVGVDLPCELTFLGTVEPEAGVREVLAFTTSGRPPEEVDAAFRAELERVGYHLQPTADANRFLAARSDTAFTTTVHHPAGSIMRGKAKAFPTAPPAGVVVELTYR